MSTINLLPDDYLKQRTQHRVNLVCMALFVVVIASVVGAYTVTDRSKQHTLEVRDRINAEYVEATELIQRMQMLEIQKTQMLSRARLTASLVERVPRSTVLAVITNARPKGTSLLKVILLTKRLQKPRPSGQLGPRKNSVYSKDPRGTTTPASPLLVSVAVTGLAGNDAQVAKFIANLARNPMIGTVDLIFSQEKVIEKTIVREFKVVLQLKNDIDAIDIIKKPQPQSVAHDGASKREKTSL